MSAQATLVREPSEQLFPSGPRGIARRLAECDRVLRAHMRRLRNDPGRHGADRWLEENQSFLQSLIRETRRELRPTYVRKLLKAGRSPSGDEPRIYWIAAAEAGVWDGNDIELLSEAVRRHSTLVLDELWAFGAVLRLALLENLCASLDSELAVSASIQTLRSLENVSWRDFVESVSAVEEALRCDPAGIYARMDFDTRDVYRCQIQRLARWSARAESEVAASVVEAAQLAGSGSGPDHLSSHVGYYLIGDGAASFSRSLGCGRSLEATAVRIVERYPGLLYASSSLIAMALVIAGFDRLLGPLPFWIFALLLIPASQKALEIVNSVVSHSKKPRPLPSMNFADGIPDSCQTITVVPALLLSPTVASRLVEDLEIRYLANRDPNLFFGLLTDFPDADQRETAADDVLQSCIEGINQLNSRYGAGSAGPFYLFHRARQWNPAESKWMGNERKRGKLNDLNQLLLGRGNAFDTVIGDRSRFAAIRYVITLDADTQLPRDSAAKLVAGMTHPLNQPVVDPVTRTVVNGYGLIRPRVSTSMVSAGQSLFAQIFSGMAGFDPYATVVSDVHQDFFGLTSFTGKGIYDLRAFDAAVSDRFPDNAVLSHDLIEGEHVRTGFLSTAELVEDYPATYQGFSKRNHRWARGDWQLLPWLFSKARNPLGLLSRWKLFDNLRRSLTEIALLLLLIAGWAWSDDTLRWTLTVLVLLLLPVYVDTLLSMLGAPESRFWRPFAQALAGQLVRRHRDTLLRFVFLPHEALMMGDAIARTMVRRFVTHRNLLEWETMAQTEAGSSGGIGIVGIYFYVSSAAALLALLAWGHSSLAVCLICEFWIGAPMVAWWLNQPPPRPVALSDSDCAFLRETALRTWRFFADHSDSDHHWLIPDNVQYDPPLTAHRISPTNLGLLLTSHLAARDFGYVTLGELSVSLRRILDTMAEMPRYRGHFYNWYETATLEPVAPVYISSVDSGNLAASLCALRQGVLTLQQEPCLGPNISSGLRDHLLRLRNQLPYGLRSVSLTRLIASLLRQLECQPADLFFWEAVLTDANTLVVRIQESVNHSCARHAGGRDREKLKELAYWSGLLGERVRAVLGELYFLAPWLAPEFESELRVNICDPSLAALMAELGSVPVLADLPHKYERVRERTIERLSSSEPLYPALRDTLSRLLQRLPDAEVASRKLIERLDRICADLFLHFGEMDFAFLFEKNRKQLRIGLNVQTGRPDEACYDLLASEARTAVLVAIAKGQIPREAWFRLGRKLTAYRNHRTLVSWSGTMFEYLMPLLHLRTYPDTVLDRALRGAIRIQQIYARERKVPWGISEAAFSDRDSLMQYQYWAFGVPPLSARSDKPQSIVVAPYASVLALMLAPGEATANLHKLAALGCVGRHGFFESIDYGARGRGPTELIRCFMAHHQGMGLLAIDNALLDGRMQERFHLDPLVQATEFLLEERMPVLVDVLPGDEEQAA